MRKKSISHKRMIKIFEEIRDRLPEEEIIPAAQSPKQRRKRQREEPLSPSDFVQSKYAKHPITIGGEGAFTKRRHLEQMQTTLAKDDTNLK